MTKINKIGLNRLAIVIPAYKAAFLAASLNSIASQTNKNFTLYICDDGSKENLFDIIKDFQDKIDIKYIRFEENLGKNDLVAHWNRSVGLVKEEWVWLFSDDDIMTKNCVQSFYDTLGLTDGSYNVYRFNIEMIDAKDKIICVKERHPEIESSYQFLLRRLNGKSLSAVIEYIFRRDIFEKEQGFVQFPLAYCSDDASWIKFAGNKPIYTIQPDVIYWRASGTNISSKKGLQALKSEALVNFIDWILNFFPNNGKEIMLYADSWFFESIKYIGGKLPISKILKISVRLKNLYPQKSSGHFFWKIFIQKV